MRLCPCGSGQGYDRCCQPLHQGSRAADSPAQLMRSRYSAYVLGETQYLLDTHHPEYRGELTLEALAEACGETHWVRLELLATPAAEEAVGYVEFKAWYREGDQLQCLHERSRFLHHQGAWLYCDGEFSPPGSHPGRNAPCPCGSGKKFKRCCG